MKQTSAALQLSPTDLSNFLGCRHLSALDLLAARGQLERPVRRDAFVEELRARGLAHETAYLEHLRAQGLSIAAPDPADGSGSSLGRAATLEAMRAGTEVIYQAALEHASWSGRVDFLRRIDAPSALGSWSYQAFDTKLARETKAGTILQLCVYSFLLERAQSLRPALMHVVAPGTFEPKSYRVDDYGAYFRLLEQGIEAFTKAPADTYPDLVNHCDYCSWWRDCESRRRADDQLCYVAGISTTQIKTLRGLGIFRLAQLAMLDSIPKPRQGSQDALERIRDQARVQVRGRELKSPYHDLREPFDTEHGLALLPQPTPDDVFLDFEGDHFAETGVQEYLIGYVTHGATGSPHYTTLWARTVPEERAAFEHFIDLAIATRRRNPAAHIYHFAPYEPAALKRLSGRYATRQTELDELLRGQVFVDLYRAVRRALVASVERYSIKDLEPFFGYARRQDLREAAMSRRIVENAIAAQDLGAPFDRHREIVEHYNREDCESTLRLRDWLESLRGEVIAKGHSLPRPRLHVGEASKDLSELDRELQRLRDGLLINVPLDPAERSSEQQARFALAHMMEFHRREDKASWWEYFRVLALDEDYFADERRALTGLRFDRAVEAKRVPIHRYGFPAQEIDARKKDKVYTPTGSRIGEVVEINYLERRIDIKKTKVAAQEHPHAVVLHNNVPAETLQKSLMRLGDAVLADGFELGDPYRAAMNLLLRRLPPGAAASGRLQRDAETTVAAACRIACALDGDVLAIQGPPGTGKTYTGTHMICALLRAGLKVGITAVSRKVILKLLEGAAHEARSADLRKAFVYCDREGTYESREDVAAITDYEKVRGGLADGTIDVVGATAWCWARPEFEQSVDVLIVDEAGQMSLANVLATAPSGRSLVLLGDPQQLEQPLQSSHPEGSEVSALYHLLDGEDTMPADKGLFLAETYRLHPDIARFTSESYYEGKVRARPGLERQAILARGSDNPTLRGSGLRYVPVHHVGNQARAPEEVERIRLLVAELTHACDWHDKDGVIATVTSNDILIVAPYNAQVAALVEALSDLADRIGTVDRFQGQEAPVVIFSMTSSSPQDAPRGMEFLYNRFRFNVATSRAKALCILVGSPALFEPECRTPRQMKLANGFCRYRELASVVDTR
jgi:uncharacterized protein